MSKYSVPERLRRELGLIALVLLAAVYVFNAWTPSHYGLTAQMLGIPDAGPILGSAHPARSDEWIVSTPYFQIAVAGDLGPRDAISPYHEPLKTFFALPSRTWAMAFQPDLWGFLVLDPAHAYSLHFAVLALAFVIGFALLLRQLGCSPGVGLAVATLLFLSQLVQVWWTSNAPVFAYAPWPAVAFLWRAPWPARLAAVFYATTVWLLGELYPPFIIAGGLALGFAVLAFRRDALGPVRLVVAVVGVAAGGAVAWLHYADLIPVMQATVFPGARRMDGGTVPAMWLTAHVLPHFTTQRYEPLPLWSTNAAEIAVVGTFLPLALACFADWRSIAAWVRSNRLSVAIWIAGLAVLAAWILLPIPGRLAPILNQAPPGRLLWGLGLLFLLGLGVLASGVRWSLRLPGAAAFVGLVLAAWWVSKFRLTHAPPALARYDLVIVPAILAAIAVGRFRPAWLAPRRAVLAALILAAAATFGRFNPVQPAAPIFERRPSLVLDAFRAYAAANPSGVVVTPGIYGAAINGAGVPALNHVLLRPQLAFFRRGYPEMPAAGFNDAFNRYEHVNPTAVWAPAVPQPDVVQLPPDPFAIVLPVAVRARPAAAGASGGIESFDVRQLGPGRVGVTAVGWADWRGVSPGQALTVALRPGFHGQIVRANAYRLATGGLVAATGDPTAFAAGFGARLEIATEAPAGQVTASALEFGSSDPVRGERRVGN